MYFILSDYYFVFLTLFTCRYTYYLWNIKETELSAGKIIIDVIMVICGLLSCVLIGIVANIFARRVEESIET